MLKDKLYVVVVTAAALAAPATLFSAILRELKAKGKDARFKKTERGKFTVNA